jgi:hypothetical protein
VHITITDDGRGIDLSITLSGIHNREPFSLYSIRECALAIDENFEIS